MNNRMTPQEKEQLKTVKKNYRELKRKNPVMFNEMRDDLIKALVNSSIPNWGGIRLNVIK